MKNYNEALKWYYMAADAGNMEALCRIDPLQIYNFKRLEKPKSMNRQMLMRLFDAYGISSGLLASEATLETACTELQKKAKEQIDAAWAAKNFIKKYSALWSESIISQSKSDQLADQITAVHQIGDDIRSRFTSVAKLKNFDFDNDKIRQLESGLAAMAQADRVKAFKDELQDVLQYMEVAESKLPEGAALLPEFTAQKQAYRTIRDCLLEDDFDMDDVDELLISLGDLKKKYIEWYMQEHKAYRLDHAASTKKGTLLQSETFKALTTLKQIDILQASQLTDLQNQLMALKTCFELTGPEMEQQAECPHCHFNPADNDAKPVHGRLGAIEDKADDVLVSWTSTLKSALEDPMLEDQKKLLGRDSQMAIDKFLQTGQLPVPVDQQFIIAVNSMLSGLESLEVHMDELQKVMISWGPSTPEDFKSKLTSWIDNQTSGKDKSKLRIIVK